MCRSRLQFSSDHTPFWFSRLLFLSPSLSLLPLSFSPFLFLPLSLPLPETPNPSRSTYQILPGQAGLHPRALKLSFLAGQRGLQRRQQASPKPLAKGCRKDAEQFADQKGRNSAKAADAPADPPRGRRRVHGV
jgi:hypothetical protein